jgi:cell division protein FtsB
VLPQNKPVDYLAAIVVFGFICYFTTELQSFKVGICMALGFAYIVLMGLVRRQDKDDASLSSLRTEVASLREEISRLQEEVSDYARR